MKVVLNGIVNAGVVPVVVKSAQLNDLNVDAVP